MAGLAKLSAPPGAILNDLRSRDGLLQSEAIRQVGRFSAPPLPADVAEYRIPEGDLEALSECEVGDCKFRLRALGVEAFSKIDWSTPDARERADTLARERLLDFARSYQESGREALKAPFVDKQEPLSPGKGFDALLGDMQGAIEASKALRAHLRDYPRSAADGMEDLIIWNVRDYGYPPVTGVVHAVIYEPRGSVPMVALKNLYSSHYFHARLQLIVLLVDPEDPEQTYLGYTDRMLFEDDVGSIKRSILEARRPEGRGSAPQTPAQGGRVTRPFVPAQPEQPTTNRSTLMSSKGTKGKIAVVTGANRGMGFEACRQLGKLGFRVVLTSRDAKKAEEAANKLRDEGLDVVAHAHDVNEPQSAEGLASFVESKYGEVHVLVNNAGAIFDIEEGASASILATSKEALTRSFETNTIGAVLTAQALVPLMKKAGYGRIVNVSSGMGGITEMNGGYPGYRLSKAALNASTRVLSEELKDDNIKVNALCPDGCAPTWVARMHT